jgi:hypothetical protein
MTLELRQGAPMQSTPNPTRTEPHDLLEIAPDVVLVARAEHELSKLARDVKRRPSQLQPQTTADSAGSSAPPVDTTFRASDHKHGPSLAARAVRGLVGLSLAICIGVAAVAWKTYGEVAGQVIAGLLPEFVARPVQPAESQSLAQPPSPPAAQESQETTAPPSPPSTQTAQDSATPPPAASPDQTQLIQSMARDLASVSRELTQLRASVAELKATQEQLSHELAKVSEQRERVRMSALPPGRPAAPVTRRPPPFRPGQAAAAPVVSPPPYAPPSVAAAPSVPPPQPIAQPPVDPDVPRPPMPVR